MGLCGTEAGRVGGRSDVFRDSFPTFRTLFGVFRTLWGHFRTLFRPFRTLFGTFRTLFGTFRTLFGTFRTLFGTFRALFGTFRTLFGTFRTLFGTFRTLFERFRTLWERFRTLFERFRTLFGTFRTLFEALRTLLEAFAGWGLGCEKVVGWASRPPLVDHPSLFFGYLKGATPWPQAKVCVEGEPLHLQADRSRPGAVASSAHLGVRPRMWHPVAQLTLCPACRVIRGGCRGERGGGGGGMLVWSCWRVRCDR